MEARVLRRKVCLEARSRRLDILHPQEVWPHEAALGARREEARQRVSASWAGWIPSELRQLEDGGVPILRGCGVTALGQLPGQEVRSEAEAGFRRHASEWWLADLYPGSSSLAHAQRSGLCSFAVSANPKRVRNV